MNYDSNGTKAVMGYSANPWGLYDMHGNVWEWTSDCYAADYPSEASVDPKGPDGASDRAYRGGGWSYGDASHCRSANRSWLAADNRLDNLGFRFILTCD
jgi:formylglycine-generating enzyme required for sulfatase activity